MMKFVNLETGKVYDGSQPYIHWFEGECGVGLIYNHKICVLNDKPSISVSIDDSIFHLIDTEQLSLIYPEEVNGFEYVDVNKLKCNNVTLKGHWCESVNKYIYIIYLIASASSAAEYISDLNIDGEIVKVGIDVYGDNEVLYVNNSNMGVNIPNAIQKAIYPTNVHEDSEDKILLNRKWKELLSNYWELVANKGSYKSLMDSLKWFEWGNRLEIKELWKYKDSIGQTFYWSLPIRTYLTRLYRDEMCRFAKSTYYAIYKASQDLRRQNGELVLDSEKNPIPVEIIERWTKDDIMLKLSLLGSFFETYFMPIHLDLIHCTIDNMVFTNNIKQITASVITRNDYYINAGVVKCSLDKNNIFSISNVSTQVNSKTSFANKDIGTKYNATILGVDKKIMKIENDDDLKLFMSQFFHGVGVMVPIEYKIPINKNDFIVKEELYICKIPKDKHTKREWISKKEHNIINGEKGIATFSFNILCQDVVDYDIRIRFTTAGGAAYVKNNIIKIIDDTNISLSAFRIKSQQPSEQLWYTAVSNEYFIDRCLNHGTEPNIIKQYIPIMLDAKTNSNKNGVQLNNVLIFLSEKLGNEWFDEYHKFLRDNYFIWHTDYKSYNENTGKLEKRKQYTICISKQYWFDPMPYLRKLKEDETAGNINLLARVYRNDYGFFPEFHYVEEVVGKKLEDYTIYEDEAICMIPLIGDLKGEPLKYGKELINPIHWEFKNVSTGQKIILDKSIREPFVSEKTDKLLDPGYYDITFKYKLGTEERKITLNSAFRRLNRR